MRILLAGVARSGTTWVGNVLGQAEGARRVSEPDGPHTDILGVMVAGRLGEYPVVLPGERSWWYQLVWDLAFAGGWPWDQVSSARAAGRGLVRVPPAVRDLAVAALAAGTGWVRPTPPHVVVKTVNSLLSIEWITEGYRPGVVVMHRDPLNVVSSWASLRWQLSPPLEDHPRIRELLLEPLKLAALDSGADDLERTAWNVGLLMTALKRAVARHPEWIVVSFDQLCLRPREEFQALFDRLGLVWTPAVDEYLALADDPGYTVHDGNALKHPNTITTTDHTRPRRELQSSQWKRRLTPHQVEEVRAVLDRFPLDGWESPLLQHSAGQT